MTVEALKALAYDHLALMERAKANLGAINEEIASREPSAKEEPAAKKK